jgi:hypothetical protein
MTKDNAADYLPLVQALAEGKKIQYRTSTGEWLDVGSPSFEYAVEKYRIKPERELRPWTPEEGIGKVVRNKVTKNLYLIVAHHAAAGRFVTVAAGGEGFYTNTPEELLHFAEQPDGSPCGVEVEL